MTMQKNIVNSVNAKPGGKGLCFTKDQLKDLHLIQRLSLVEIGKKYGVSGPSIKYWMNKVGLKNITKINDIDLEPSPTLSYIYGVLHGDGFLYKNPANLHKLIILRATDIPFVRSFESALTIIGIKPMFLTLKPEKEHYKIPYEVRGCSSSFHKHWYGMSRIERLKFGLTYKWDFIRGVYESDGSLRDKINRNELTLTMYKPNFLLLQTIKTVLKKELNLVSSLKQYTTAYGTRMYYLSLYRRSDIKKFLTWTKPCIKYLPRRQVNTELNQNRNVLESVESKLINTKY